MDHREVVRLLTGHSGLDICYRRLDQRHGHSVEEDHHGEVAMVQEKAAVLLSASELGQLMLHLQEYRLGLLSVRGLGHQLGSGRNIMDPPLVGMFCF